MKRFIILALLVLLIGACCISIAAAESENVITNDAHRHNTQFVSLNEREHGWQCTDCGKIISASKHNNQCTDPDGHCSACGADGVVINSQDHNNTTRLSKDEKRHELVCLDCNAVIGIGWHRADCSAPDTCSGCGATNIVVYDIDHRYSWDSYEHDEVSHWRVCTVCGETGYRSEHYSNCSSPSICRECGAEDCVMGWIGHECTKDQYDNQQHWEACPDCGKTLVKPSAHKVACDQPGICAMCGAVVSGKFDIEHNYDYNNAIGDDEGCRVYCLCGASIVVNHYRECHELACQRCGYTGINRVDMWHNYDCPSDQNIQHDQDHCWFLCDVCGAEYWKTEHRVGCTAPDVCVYCNTPTSEISYQLVHDYVEKDGVMACRYCDWIEEATDHVHHWIHTGESEDILIRCSLCGKIPEAGDEVDYSQFRYDEITFDDEYHYAVMYGKYGLNIKKPHTFEVGICIFCGYSPREDVMTESDWQYRTENGEAAIVAWSGSQATAEVPQKVEGRYPVTTISAGTFAESIPDTLTIPESITYIEYGSLAGISLLRVYFNSYSENYARINYLPYEVINPDGFTIENGVLLRYTGTQTNIVIPEGVTAIASRAFEACGSIDSLTLPESLRSIGDFAFAGNHNWTQTLRLSPQINSLGRYAFGTLSNLTLAAEEGSYADYWIRKNWSGKTTIEQMFDIDDNKRLSRYNGTSEHVYIPEGVLTIGSWAFNNQMVSATMPDSVTAIEAYAFGNCNELSFIQLPDNISSLGEKAFPSNCRVLWNPGTITDETIRAFEFEKDEAGTTLVKYHGFDQNVVIPEGIEHIGENAFYNNTDLQTVTLPEDTLSIGERAFFWCTSLTTINIPDSVKSIGEYAFYGDISLRITLPDDLESIGANAFHLVKKVYYNANTHTALLMESGDFVIEDGVLTAYQGTGLFVTIPDGVTEIGEGAFCGKKVVSIIIPEGVTVIDDWAFSDCNSLSQISFPSTLTSIGYHSFHRCVKLKKLAFSDGLTSIDSEAFWSCASLQTVVFPDTLKQIGYGAFSECGSLQSVTFGAGLQTIGDEAFQYTGLTEIAFPTSLKTIGNSAFAYTELQNVTLPSSLKFVDDAAFACNQQLSSVTICGQMTMGYALFAGCTALETVTMDEGATGVADQMFSGCRSLKHVNLPDTITTICELAFNECVSLENLVLPESVTSIGADTFYGCTALTAMNLPSGITSIGDHCFDRCRSLTATVDLGSYAMDYCRANNIRYAVNLPLEINALYLPASLTVIEDEAFAHVEADAVYIPMGCTSIGSRAFAGSSVVSVHIASEQIAIADDAFDECDPLVVYCTSTSSAADWCDLNGIYHLPEQ